MARARCSARLRNWVRVHRGANKRRRIEENQRVRSDLWGRVSGSHRSSAIIIPRTIDCPCCPAEIPASSRCCARDPLGGGSPGQPRRISTGVWRLGSAGPCGDRVWISGERPRSVAIGPELVRQSGRRGACHRREPACAAYPYHRCDNQPDLAGEPACSSSCSRAVSSAARSCFAGAGRLIVRPPPLAALWARARMVPSAPRMTSSFARLDRGR